MSYLKFHYLQNEQDWSTPISHSELGYLEKKTTTNRNILKLRNHTTVIFCMQRTQCASKCLLREFGLFIQVVICIHVVIHIRWMTAMWGFFGSFIIKLWYDSMMYFIHLIKVLFLLSLIYQEPDMSGSQDSLVYVPKEKRKRPVKLTVCLRL